MGALFALLVLASLIVPLPAFAHVPWVEATPGTGPYEIGSPDVSRALYGALGPGEEDTYTFTVPEDVSTTVELLVPVRPALRTFYPTLRIEGPGGAQVAVANRDRPEFYEPFSIASFWRVASLEATLASGAEYRLVVADPVDAPGPYVVAFGGPEAFGSLEIAETLRVLPRIWLGSWGGEPVRPSAIAILTITAVAVLLVVAWIAWRLVTNRGSRARP